MVGDETLVAPARAVVVATGSGPAMPPIDGLREAKPWTNREATTAKQVPERLTILGGGVVGVEMAQAWSSARLAGHADRGGRPPARARGAVRRRGGRAGAARARRGRPQGRQGRRRCAPTAARWSSSWSRATRCPATSCWWRSAAGPNTTDLGPRDGRPRARQADRGRRPHARPGSDWLYAIGDVNGRALLTHMGKYQARIAADTILGPGGALPDPRRRARRRA